MFDVNQITSTLRGMADKALQQYAMMNKGNPYILSLAVAESNQRKQLRTAAQARAMAPQPKVADAAIAGIAQEPQAVDAMGNVTGMAAGGLPEDYGIGRLPAPNIQRMADGGIAGYGDGDDVPKRNGMAQGGMYDFAQRSEPVVRMSGGGIPGYKDTGKVVDYRQAIIDEAQMQGVPAAVALQISGVESNFDPNAKPIDPVTGKPRSSAKSFFQVIDSTYKNLGGDPKKRNDPMENIRVGVKSLAENQTALAKQLGRAPKPQELYTTHFLGTDTGAKLLSADPNTPVSAFLDKADPKNKEKILNANPEVLGGKKTVGDVLSWTQKKMAPVLTAAMPMGSAQAEEPPKAKAAAPEYQGEKAKQDPKNLNANAAAVGGTSLLSGLSALAPRFLDKFAPSLVNDPKALAQTLRASGVAGGTLAAVPAIGGAFTVGAANALSNATPEQLEQLQGDIGSDTGIAAAIMNPENRKPENAPKMSSGEQIAKAAAFIPKFITQHPDLDRMREANKAKEEQAKPAYDPYKMEPVRYDEFGPPNIGPEALDLSKKEMDAVAKDAKEATPVEARKGLTNDDYLMMGLSLLANKSPNLGTAIGEAGVATLGAKKEREKAEREEAKLKGSEELQKAQAKYYTAYGDAIERGAKEKNLELEAEKKIGDRMEAWDKANKAINMTNPTARMEEEARIRQQIYASLGIKPIMAGQANPASQSDPLGILNKR